MGRNLSKSQALHEGITCVSLTSPDLLLCREASYLGRDVVLTSCISFSFQAVEAEEDGLVGVFEEEAVHCRGGLFVHHV